MSIQQTWEVLAERERARMALSNTKRPETTAEKFYAVSGSINNRAANRYSNILAYDRTAVIVEGEYLNANVVKDSNGKWWVASQAPLPHTFELFFEAIQTRSASRHPLIQAHTGGAIILQLTGLQENGAKKADQYLEHVTVDQQRQRSDIACVVSNFRLGEVLVVHYLFTAWPDFGVPKGEAIEALRNLVQEILREGEGKEVWVHCSAGVGRSGTFIALSSLLSENTPSTEESPLGPLSPPIAQDRVACTVDSMRDWRGALIQTMEQFNLVYALSKGS